jgi:hypothetical protein
MLRPTVSKAFRAPEGERREKREELALTGGRWQAVQTLFADLHGEIRQRVEESAAALGGAAGIDGPGVSTAAAPRAVAGRSASPRERDRAPPPAFPRLGKKRSLAEGMEFVLETPEASWRFLNTLSGVLWVYVLAEGSWVLSDLISVQRKGDAYCPIWKPVASGRAAYRFTSVRSLADAYLQVT